MNMFVSTAAAVAAVPTIGPALASNQSDESHRLSAMLARAEEIVDLLRTCYVREGWKIDEAAAERALQYFRKSAADGSDDDELREAAIAFLSSHGQSLDWVFDGNPVGMICGLAKHSRRASAVVARRNDVLRAAGDEQLWSLYEKFERSYNRMKSLETEQASAGSGRDATPEQKSVHKRWERAASGAFRAARRVMAEPAHTGNGLLMKIHVAGFDLDTAKGTFTMPYRGIESPAWKAGRFSDAGADFVASIAADLRRAKLALG